MSLNILVYLSILIFFIAALYRIIRITTTPIHLRWELYPVPHEGLKKMKYGGSYLEEPEWWTKPRTSSKIGALLIMIPEILLLKGVWESNRKLWFWSWSFHVGLYFGIGAIALFVLSILFNPLSTVGNLIFILGKIITAAAYIMGTIGCLGMLFKRFFDEKLKGYSSFASRFNLLFILSIFITGIGGWIGTDNYFVGILYFISRLLTFSSAPPPDTVVSWHISLISLFLIYLPFTHMSHAFMKYFTWDSIRWDDRPNIKGSSIEKKVKHALNYRPTWAAKHIGADGKKSWADIATEDLKEDE